MGVPYGPCIVLAAHIQPVMNRCYGDVLLPRQPLPGEEMDLAARFSQVGIPARYEPFRFEFRVRRRRQKSERIGICPDFVIETKNTQHYMLCIEVKRRHADRGEFTKLLAVTRAFRDRHVEAMMLLWEPQEIYTTMPRYAIERLLCFLGFDPSEWAIRPLAPKAQSLKSWHWQLAA